MLKILTTPDPRLQKKSQRLTLAELKTPAQQKFIAELIEAMGKYEGVGIAAPQVGKNIRIIIVDTEHGPEAFINPQIIWKSLGKEVGEEGCLSVPGVWGLVKRSKSLFLTYRAPNGQRKNLRAKGLMARVLQHEIDHLDGILFIDKMIQQTEGH